MACKFVAPFAAIYGFTKHAMEAIADGLREGLLVSGQTNIFTTLIDRHSLSPE
jgi:NADP-dependent 3-hydroxy acid dehydrogenase YdfG